MAGYIGSKTSVTVTSPETDSRYVNTSGDTMTGSLTVGGNVTANTGNGNLVALTTDGAIEIKKSNGQGYIDFRDADEDFDCRIAQYSNGLQFVTGGAGSTGTAITIDSSRKVGVGTTPSSGGNVAPLTVGHNGGFAYGTVIQARTFGDSDDPVISLENYNGGSPVRYGIGLMDNGSLRFSSDAYEGGWGTDRMYIGPTGHIKTPYQPACVAHTGAGWLNMQANNAYGIGGFHYNRGGFYNGGALGGYNVVHVPATGLYRVTLNIYLAGNHAGRIYVKKNNATDVCFIQTVNTNVDSIQCTEGLIEMNQGDYLNYYVLNNLNTYHNNHHTYVMVEYIG